MINDPPNKKRLLIRNEVADRLRLKPSTVKKKTLQGEIPHVRIGNTKKAHVRYREEDIDRYITDHTQHGTKKGMGNGEAI